VKAVLSPNFGLSMNAAAPLTVEWPDGYSGCAGVPGSQGIQAASEFTLPGSRMAVIGRQNTYRYLLSQHAIPASAMATFISANKCAFCDRVSDRAAAICNAMRFQYSGVLPAQKSASSDWSLLLPEPSKTPMVRTSL